MQNASFAFFYILQSHPNVKIVILKILDRCSNRRNNIVEAESWYKAVTESSKHWYRIENNTLQIVFWGNARTNMQRLRKRKEEYREFQFT